MLRWPIHSPVNLRPRPPGLSTQFSSEVTEQIRSLSVARMFTKSNRRRIPPPHQSRKKTIRKSARQRGHPRGTAQSHTCNSKIALQDADEAWRVNPSFRDRIGFGDYHGAGVETTSAPGRHPQCPGFSTREKLSTLSPVPPEDTPPKSTPRRFLRARLAYLNLSLRPSPRRARSGSRSPAWPCLPGNASPGYSAPVAGRASRRVPKRHVLSRRREGPELRRTQRQVELLANRALLPEPERGAPSGVGPVSSPRMTRLSSSVRRKCPSRRSIKLSEPASQTISAVAMSTIDGEKSSNR